MGVTPTITMAQATAKEKCTRCSKAIRGKSGCPLCVTCSKKNNLTCTTDNEECSVLPRPFSEGGTPCRFLVTPCPFQEAEMTPCPFLGDAQRRPVTFYLTPNVTVHGNRRGNYAARTFPLFYSTAFVIVIRLVYKNLRYWPIRIYFGRLAIDCCINFIQ